MKTLVITPAYLATDPRLDEAVARAGLPWMRLYGFSDQGRVRSILLTRALATGADFIILVDADNVPRPEQFELAVRLTSPESAAWGIYEQREPGVWSVEPEGEAKPEGFPLVFGGLGFACVHRDALERVAVTLGSIPEGETSWKPFCVPFVEGPEYHGNDKSFCTRLRRTGTRLVCYPELRVGHAVTRVV